MDIRLGLPDRLVRQFIENNDSYKESSDLVLYIKCKRKMRDYQLTNTEMISK